MMRAVNISSGVDMNKILSAVSSEIESHILSSGGLDNAFLVIHARVCEDERSVDEAPLALPVI